MAKKEIDVTNGIDGQSAYELAVKNGFEGSEQEWLESLRYDHSEEFTVLAEQVKQDVQSSAENASKAETAMNQANQTAQDNIEVIQQASAQAQEDITSAKTTSVNAVEQAQKDAEQSIATKHSEAVASIESAQSTAETAIDAKQAESVQAIESAKEEATQAIETGKTEAVAAITTAKDEAIEEIENTGVPLEDIEKLAIKETAEGNPTIISDSTDWRLQSLNVCGQSEQVSTTGAQLLDSSLYKESATGSGVTYTKQSDGSIKRTGTATNIVGNVWLGGDYFGSKDDPNYKVLFTLQAGTYTVKDCILFSLTKSYQNTFTIDEPLEISGLRNENFEVGKTYNDVIYPMLNKGSIALPFEPYTGGKPSPSPEYPQEIISKKVSEINVTNGADLSQTITLTEPITLRGIPISSDGNVTIDGQQYVSDEICEKDGVIGVERNIAEVKKPKGTHFDFVKEIYSSSTERFFADYGFLK